MSKPKKLTAPVLSCILVALGGGLWASTAFTYKKGATNPFWKDGAGSERDVTATVSVPANTTVSVVGYRDGNAVDTQQASGGNPLNYTFNDVDEIRITWSFGSGDVTGSACVVGAGAATSTTYDATRRKQTLFSRAHTTTVNFLVHVTSPGSTATIQAFDGDTLLGEWEASEDDPLGLTIDCRKVVVLEGSGEGTFDYSTGASP